MMVIITRCSRLKGILSKICSFGREQTGSFTLDAAITLPIIMLALIAIISFSFTLYLRSDLYATAAAAADRAAHNWDNSAKDPITGAVPVGQVDPLYWRTGN